MHAGVDSQSQRVGELTRVHRRVTLTFVPSALGVQLATSSSPNSATLIQLLVNTQDVIAAET